MRVGIPSVLQSYTAGARTVEAEGATLAELLVDLDRRHPGLRFRMVNERDALRPHMRVFVNKESISDLDHPLAHNDEVLILHALSGG
jgi:molybdopterin converting factor small subunit